MNVKPFAKLLVQIMTILYHIKEKMKYIKILNGGIKWKDYII